MRLSRKTLFAIVLSLVGAITFARLGFWQLSRLAERRAYNAHLEERLAAPPVVVTSLSADSGTGHYAASAPVESSTSRRRWPSPAAVDKARRAFTCSRRCASPATPS